MLVEGVGHRQVARQNVVQRGNIGRTLDAGMAAQRHDAPPGRPMFPISNCSSAQAEIICGPLECWVQPTA
jgi:hypothetical protein